MLAGLPPRGCQPKLSREARAEHGVSLVPEGPGALGGSEGGGGSETKQVLWAGPYQYLQTCLSRKQSLVSCCVRGLL